MVVKHFLFENLFSIDQKIDRFFKKWILFKNFQMRGMVMIFGNSVINYQCFLIYPDKAHKVSIPQPLLIKGHKNF